MQVAEDGIETPGEDPAITVKGIGTLGLGKQRPTVDQEIGRWNLTIHRT